MYDTNGMMNIARLRERAAELRQFARRALSNGVATEFEKLASDYDQVAARLDASGPDSIKALS
jgi:hypothetical protein